MKSKSFRLLPTIALALCLLGCAQAAPQTAGSIGGVEISTALYALAQYDAYQQAVSLASGQNATDTRTFLADGIITDSSSGQSMTAGEYVEQKTLENLEVYAAVQTRFAALGGTLSAADEAQAESYSSQLFEQYGSAYKANGITQEALLAYELNMIKEQRLLTLIYGSGGEKPVADAQLIACLQSDFVYACCAVVPLYGAETLAAVSDSQAAEMLALAQEAVAGYNAAVPQTAAAQQELFEAAVISALPEIYGAHGESYKQTAGDFSCRLFTVSVLQSSFNSAAAEAVLALKEGEAAAVRYSEHAIMLLVRLNAAEAAGLDTLREDILRELKGAELRTELKASGAKLEHRLDAMAVAALPAENITENIDQIALLFSSK